MNAPVRILASPFARRLARERGVPLSQLAGSGPNGRIVAADMPLEMIAEVVPVDLPATVTPPLVAAVTPVRAIGAFATTVDLTPLRAFISAYATELSLAAFLIKAAGRAAGSYADGVSWQASDGEHVAVMRAAGSSPTEIARLIAAGAGPESGRLISLSRLKKTGIRPLSAALPEGIDLRLLVIAGEGSSSAEVLLVHDAGAIDEEAAVNILAAFRDLAEAPLRLLV